MEKGVMEDLLSYYKRAMRLKGADADTYSPLVLAYIGDAVYEVMVRTKVVDQGNVQVSKLHKSSSRLVCAQAQARMIHLLEESLSPKELAVFKRGRNAKSATSAKNASISEYRLATGFEALIGWLFLSEQFERLIGLVGYGLEQIEEERAPAGSAVDTRGEDPAQGGQTYLSGYDRRDDTWNTKE